MQIKKSVLIIVMSILIGYPAAAMAVSAFPGAQGFGAKSVGGRGGVVLKVTNLNDSGAGSLRAAVNTSGPRTVVFAVSGTISLQSDLYILNPYITIAGQTSPGGILITGKTVVVNTHDVILRHLRLRIGSHNVANAETHDTIGVYGNAVQSWFPNDAYNIIIDHCSISWGIDENFALGLNVMDATVQWSIISEGLRNAGHPKGSHSNGLLVDTKYTTVPMRISVHHNYFAHNSGRNPYIAGTTQPVVDVVNNVVYNFYGALAMTTEGNVSANFVHNYIKPGVDSLTHGYEVAHLSSETPSPRFYLKGNLGLYRKDQSADDWSIGRMWYTELLNPGFKRTTPLSAAPVKTSTASLETANCILSAAGATAPVRDSVDNRVVNDFTNGTGRIIDNISYPADFPVFTSPAPPADADNDGMADAWEQSVGLNPSTNDSALDRNNDGYTNIEDYLNYLSTKSYSFNAACMPDTSVPEAPKNVIVR